MATTGMNFNEVFNEVRWLTRHKTEYVDSLSDDQFWFVKNTPKLLIDTAVKYYYESLEPNK